jgi:lactoylglutathione lyase
MTDDEQVGIVGIGTVGIPVDDQDRALAFYRDVLGFAVMVDTPLPQTASRWIMLAPPGSAVSIALVAATDDVPAGVETGVRFASADAAATHGALSARGADVGALLEWPGVPPMFAVRDTEGNRFEVIEVSPGPTTAAAGG